MGVREGLLKTIEGLEAFIARQKIAQDMPAYERRPEQ